jgi:hypothetical protein
MSNIRDDRIALFASLARRKLSRSSGIAWPKTSIGLSKAPIP